MSSKNLLEYKGYHGSYELSVEDAVFNGKIEFIKDLVTYEGENAKQIVRAFEEAVDDYLETCKSQKKNPDKPFKGSFNVRIGEELHRQAAIEASKSDMTLNSFIKNLIQEKISF